MILIPVFRNVNGEDEVYGLHFSFDRAILQLWQFPNDRIVITLHNGTEALHRFLSDGTYNLDMALQDGMTDEEYSMVVAD